MFSFKLIKKIKKLHFDKKTKLHMLVKAHHIQNLLGVCGGVCLTWSRLILISLICYFNHKNLDYVGPVPMKPTLARSASRKRLEKMFDKEV